MAKKQKKENGGASESAVASQITNKVTLRGRISYIIDNGSACYIHIRINKNDEHKPIAPAAGAAPAVLFNIPSVTIVGEKMIASIADRSKIRAGKRVEIVGHIQTSKVRPSGAVYADKVTPLLDRAQALFADEPYVDDTNEVLLDGTVGTIRPIGKDGISFPLGVDYTDAEGNVRTAFPRIVAYAGTARAIKRLPKDARIRVVCYYQTRDVPGKDAGKDADNTGSNKKTERPRRNNDMPSPNMRRFESFVAQSIEVVTALD